MIGVILIWLAMTPAESSVVESDIEGLVLCLNNAHGAALNIGGYGTSADDERALGQIYPDVQFSRIERPASPLMVTGASDRNTDAAARSDGLLMYDREVARRDDGGVYGYMIASYSINPTAYQCVLVRAERTCFTSLKGFPVVARCS